MFGHQTNVSGGRQSAIGPIGLIPSPPRPSTPSILSLCPRCLCGQLKTLIEPICAYLHLIAPIRAFFLEKKDCLFFVRPLSTPPRTAHLPIHCVFLSQTKSSQVKASPAWSSSFYEKNLFIFMTHAFRLCVLCASAAHLFHFFACFVVQNPYPNCYLYFGAGGGIVLL